MQAVLLKSPGGPDSLELVELPTPAPGEGQVRVRAQAIGLGRPDVMMRTGQYKWMPPLPGIIGNELAGVVDVLGAGVPPSWLGRTVLVSSRELDARGGCYAAQVVVPAAALIELPDGVDPAHAVALPNYQLAWGLLHEATRGRLPRSVYLNGAAGGVGSALIQLCGVLGIAVVAGAGSDEKRRFASELGAASTVDTRRASDEVIGEALELHRGGVDLVLDHLCGPSFSSHLQMLAPFGLLVSYNALRGAAGDDVFSALRALASKAIGIAAFNMHAYNGVAMRQARRALLDKPIQWLADGRLHPVVTRMPLADVREAHRRLDDRSVIGKLVLIPS